MEPKSFIVNYDKEDQEKLNERVEDQINKIMMGEAQKQVDQNRDRIYNNFEALSKNRGDKNRFLLLIQSTETYDSARNWEIMDSRQDAFDYLREGVDGIDLIESLVVSETLSFVDSLTAADFLIYCIENEKVEINEPFDPRDYLPDDYEVEYEDN